MANSVDLFQIKLSRSQDDAKVPIGIISFKKLR